MSESNIPVAEGESFAKKKPMTQAYLDGKDLYCVIATGMFNNNYEDNLEFYMPAVEIEIDGKKVITGDGSSAYELEVSDGETIELKPFNVLEIVDKGDVQAAYLVAGDRILNGPIITAVKVINNKVLVSF